MSLKISRANAAGAHGVGSTYALLYGPAHMKDIEFVILGANVDDAIHYHRRGKDGSTSSSGPQGSTGGMSTAGSLEGIKVAIVSKCLDGSVALAPWLKRSESPVLPQEKDREYSAAVLEAHLADAE